MTASLDQLQRQRAVLVQDVTELGQDYQRMRQSLAPRIQRLQAEADDLARQFKPLVQQAVDVYGTGRKTEAKQLSERRKALQSQSEARNAEANVLRQELAAALQDLRSAEAKLKKLNEDIRRLEQAQSGSTHKKDDKRAIAQRAGVPYQSLDNILASRQADGLIHIYFGGVGKPDGPGHGHYVMDQYDRVVYRREPFDPHGAQNSTGNRREHATRRMAEMAMNQWAKTQTTPWTTQYEDSEFKVNVKSGYDHRHSCIVTDLLIHDKQNKQEHYHLVIDEHGNQLFSEWRTNRT